MKKNYYRISELGSMMIEALSMLALIALVTPILYKKSAERTTELQDINAASELRAIGKAVDDFISAHYDAITKGEPIETTCPGDYQNPDFGDYSSAGEPKEEYSKVYDLGNFCEFMPYGILDANGKVSKSKLFKDYKAVVKLSNGKVLTSFVIADPHGTDSLSQMRASSIASMIGGNGGFSQEDNKINGNLGIWSIDNTNSELSTAVKKGSVVSASIEGITSQNANINVRDVLYRNEQSDPDLNSMSTTLNMFGAQSSGLNDIINIGRLIVGGEEAAESDDKLYIKSGDIRIGSGEGGETGNIIVDGGGNVSLNGGGSLTISDAEAEIVSAGPSGITVTDADIVIQKSADAGDGATGPGGNLIVSGTISAADDLFQVATDGALTIYNNIGGGSEAVQIHTPTGGEGDAYKTLFNEAVEIRAEGDCPHNTTYTGSGDDITSSTTLTGDCAFFVDGDALIGGNLTVKNTFAAKNLHAEDKLTVGGPGKSDSKALSVTYNGTAGELNFGEGVLTLTQTGDDTGDFNFGNGFVHANNTGSEGVAKQFSVNNADTIDLNTATERFLMDTTDGTIAMGAGVSGETVASGINMTGDGKIDLIAEDYIALNDSAFYVDKVSGTAGEEGSVHEITSSVQSFKITPSTDNVLDGFFQVGLYGTEGSTANQVRMEEIDTHMVNAHQFIRNGAFHLQGASGTSAGEGSPLIYPDIVRIGENSGDGQIDISGDAIYAHYVDGNKTNGAEKVLKIDLTKDSENNNNYPVYVRKGAIELTEVENASEGHEGDLNFNTYKNYVKADRFVANHELETGALIGTDGVAIDNEYSKYEINPAYTSIMHDIKLTTRGGARLSDILPDFINKGIYVVDNTYPAIGETCTDTSSGSEGGSGKSLEAYKSLDYTSKGKLKTCNSVTEEVSPWAGFVPTPTCPPGYSKVITLTPASFAMAEAGIPFSKTTWTGANRPVDLSVPYVVKSPYDYLDDSYTDAPPVPLYYQKNTWLKSFVEKYESGGSFKGWDVGMGFIYPYNLYSDYINKLGGRSHFDGGGCPESGGDTNSCVIWNLFPVKAGTLEGYATVYCYFNRKSNKFLDSMVDKEYDQLDNFRDSDVKSANELYLKRLNDDRISGLGIIW